VQSYYYQCGHAEAVLKTFLEMRRMHYLVRWLFLFCVLEFCEQADVEFDARHDRKYHNTHEALEFLLACLMDIL